MMNLNDEEILKLRDPKTSKEERSKLLARQYRTDKKDDKKMTLLISIPFILIFLFWVLDGI